MSSKLTVAKIVASSTPSAWSQAYHAGGFTAVVSLSPKEGSEEPLEGEALHKAGKDILDTLIAEYFTLTTKDLETIKGAATTTIEKVPPQVTVSLVVGATVKNILYIVACNGKALLKRGSKMGTLLEADNSSDPLSTQSVSGYLEPDDLVILQTAQFGELLPHHELVDMLSSNSPADIAEMLAPKVHGAQNGGASAIVFSYHEEAPTVLEKTYPESLPTEEKQEPQHPSFFDDAKEDSQEKPTETPKPSGPKPSFHFSHSQRIFLTISVILALVLFSSIFFFISREQAAKQEKLFQSIYTPAKAKFDEGEGLIDLNKASALADLQSAKDTISPSLSKFPTNSSYYKQLNDLLTKVNQGLQTAENANTVEATKATDNASPLLAFQAAHTSSSYVATDGTNFYTADNTGISKFAKNATSGKQLISADWKAIGGFGIYFGNIYVADQKDGVLKYVPAGSSFGKASSYFASGVNPDLSKTVSLSIDGSIWLLSSDGAITKYTRGTQDSFSVSGLDKPLVKPTQILTSVDDDNVYVLDRGNGRVVVLKKSGTYVTAYQTGIIKTADGIDVDEKNKLLYILSGGTVYQVAMK